MKTTATLFALVLLGTTSAFAQATDAIVKDYLNVKNALVDGNSQQAAAHAATLLQNVEQTAPFDKKEKLLKSIQKIAETTDIEKQREELAQISPILWKLIKTDGELSQPLYYQYCPMKKVYWISGEEAIKNPYYGAKMLTCGNTTETKPAK